jgi:hypothetical protein
MADKPLTAAPDETAVDREPELPDRNEELCHEKELSDAAEKMYDAIQKGYEDQWERANSILDYWDIYNCELGPKQFYAGNSKIFVPIVADAIDARKTRFTNQIFPATGKNVEVISSEEKPQDLMSLLEFYIRKSRLRSQVVPALLKNGDVEGQYNLMMHWVENERYVAWREHKAKTLDEDPELTEPEEDMEGYEDIREEKIINAFPMVEVLSDADVLVLPFTASNIDEALDAGGSVTVLRRWSEAQVERMIADEEIDADRGEELITNFAKIKTENLIPDKKGRIVDAAGIKHEGGKKWVAYVYETWTKLTYQGERRIFRIRYGGKDLLLSVKRNPFWCDHVPIISAASDRVEGSFKGRSRIKRIETIQYAANDAINEGMDTAAYALLPIVMTDPLKNPRTSTMVMNVAAVWETSPKDTQFAQFPSLYKDAFEIVNACKMQVFQSLGVNPAMLPSSQGSQGKGKTNQAQVAQEQQIDILMTADVVTSVEPDVLTPILRWMIYLDHQYRNEAMTIRQFGKMGLNVEMQEIPPIQMDRRFEVKWFGVEAARSAQQMQLQMGGLNVIRGIPPQSYPGFRLNIAPVLQQFAENLFGPRLAAQIFEDQRSQLTISPQFENGLLAQGFDMPVGPLDQDQEHIQAHMQAMQQAGDRAGVFRVHMMKHMQSMQMKQMQQAQQQQQLPPPPQQQGGGPRQGAMPGRNRGGQQQPPGAIQQDQMRDAHAMPRARGMMR